MQKNSGCFQDFFFKEKFPCNSLESAAKHSRRCANNEAAILDAVMHLLPSSMLIWDGLSFLLQCQALLSVWQVQPDDVCHDCLSSEQSRLREVVAALLQTSS